MISTHLYGQLKTETFSKQQKAFYSQNRMDFIAKMPANSVAVVFANPIRNRSNDVDYPYYQNTDFLYLTGFKEPHSVLVLFKQPQYINGSVTQELLYVAQKDPLVERWIGTRLGVAKAQVILGVKQVLPTSAFLTSTLDFSSFDKVLFDTPKTTIKNTKSPTDLYDLQTHFLKKIEYAKRVVVKQKSKNDGVAIFNTITSALREIKKPYEIQQLKKAIAISAQGQIEVMRALDTTMTEMQVDAIHELVYKKYHAKNQGYPAIVGTGANGCVLHYTKNTSALKPTDLLLMDVGAQYNGYTADVTRTIAVNGVFSKEQKAIYNLVLKAQQAAINASVVGAPFFASNTIARNIINQGLTDLGIIASPNIKHDYLPHGISHYLGLDVHDKGNYGPLQENMVITIEPGIYIPKGSPCAKKWWDIAVRIEDDILITKKGPINLSSKAPREISEIEALMQEKSPLQDFILPNLSMDVIK